MSTNYFLKQARNNILLSYRIGILLSPGEISLPQSVVGLIIIIGIKFILDYGQFLTSGKVRRMSEKKKKQRGALGARHAYSYGHGALTSFFLIVQRTSPKSRDCSYFNFIDMFLSDRTVVKFSSGCFCL